MRGDRLSSHIREAALEKGGPLVKAATREARSSSRPWGRPRGFVTASGVAKGVPDLRRLSSSRNA
eukprot:9490107-Pyramimonas_sp.AAC.1